ncbi:MAG TPA: hypothetical protein PLF81_31785 [Candidatus Anammoximicrobium sp.]|nr:hypothetical protein [Candidatus Anammoximicrobium sp.]
MVAKTPLDRYQTMAEVIAELEPFCRPAASAPARSPSVVEDSQLDAFLRGLGPSASPRRSRMTSSQPAPAAVKTKTAPAAPPAAADPAVTEDWSEAHAETATKMEPSLPRAEPAKAGTTSARSAGARSAAFRRSKPAQAGTTNWRDWRWLAAVGAGGLLVILLGIWVVVRDKDGKEVARIPVPEGGSVTVEMAAKNEAAKPAKSGDKAPQSKTAAAPLPAWNLPPGSPPPAIAPFDAVKAKEHQGAWAKYLGVDVESENSIGIRFVLVPPGEFDMGSTEAEVVNGARIGGQWTTTQRRRWTIQRGRREARAGCSGAAVGASTRPSAGRLTASGTILAPATSPSASASRGQFPSLIDSLFRRQPSFFGGSRPVA